VSLPVASDTPTGFPAFVEVAVLPAIPGKDVLTYRVPDRHRETVRPGMRVLVPLGRRHETGLVVALTGTPPAAAPERVRDLEDLLDTEPILTEELFALCRWAARYYVTTLTEVLATALPGGLRASTTRVVRLADPAPPGGARGSLEAAILATLGARGALDERRLARALGRPGVGPALRALADRKLVVVEERIRPPAGATRFEAVLTLGAALAERDAADLARRAPAQHALYERLRAAGGRLAAGTMTPRERVAAAALVRRGLAARAREERYRDARPPVDAAAAPPVLTAEQQAVMAAVPEAPAFRGFLLHGVTGSGKTEVYLRLAARAVAAGRSALLLVPEIALTHQLVRRVQERFGARVALLHSALAPGERWDEWRRILRGEAVVVVGTRSAVFAPLARLGVVIVDEEHDAAYKQDEGLRYQGRDLALVRAKLAGVPAVLGSATPSVESYHQAASGRFTRLALPTRVEGRPLPTVEIVDLRARDRTDSRLFSRRLLETAAGALARREQVLLFLNRRGFAPIMQCVACGEPTGCPSCTVSLTWHQRRNVLLCHHCGFTRPPAARCGACGSGELVALGEGTEQVEAEVVRLFPEARIARLDRDTIGSKGAHRRILDAWREGALDVLIGTQMVAKGHDVPGVTVVGVLLADVALNLPDFRAGERAFQLLTQVAGRAGRGSAPGRVIVQTYRPEHHSLVAAAAHDFEGFAARELAMRAEVGYPPFERLAVLRLEGADAAATEDAAQALAAAATRAAAGRARVRGPAPAPLERLRGRWRWQIMLTTPSAAALNDALRRALAAWRGSPRARAIRLVVDVDPVSML